MYLIRFCFAYIFFFFAVIILQLIPSLDFIFSKKTADFKHEATQKEKATMSDATDDDKVAA